MTTFYRNRETGKVQAHPTPGLGEFLNSDEIGEDGKPLAYLPISDERIEAHRAADAEKHDDGEPADDEDDTNDKDGDQ